MALSVGVLLFVEELFTDEVRCTSLEVTAGRYTLHEYDSNLARAER